MSRRKHLRTAKPTPSATALSGRRALAVTLSVAVGDGASPPTEFRIFTAGVVTTSKGDFTFDDEAAARVLADYEAQGNELMVDYDHAALNTNPVDPAASGRAAGWFGLEMRGGELWAVDVRWTEPAKAALLAKEWRYMSPAFQTEEGRIVALLNVALTNIPATKKLEPLMAANTIAASEGMGMTLEEMMKVAEALGLGADATLDDFLAKIGAMKAEEKPKAEEPKPEAMGDAPKPEDEEKQAEVMAAASKLKRLADEETFGAAVAKAELWRTSHIEVQAERVKLAAERAALEIGERRAALAHLVAAGARKPFEVWAPGADGLPDGKTPHEEHASMSLARLKALVAAHPIAAKPNGTPRPPAGAPGAASNLSDSERRMAADRKWNAEQTAAYVAKRDAIAARSGRKPAQTEN